VKALHLASMGCAIALMSACGLKGPLELPEKSSGVVIRTATGETTTTGGPKAPPSTQPGTPGTHSTTPTPGTTPAGQPSTSSTPTETAPTPTTSGAATPATEPSPDKPKRHDIEHPLPPPLPGGNPGD
jgi:predicted small lipoprotein YifL